MDESNGRSATEIDKKVGERLRIIRQNKKMSQMELGHKLGLTFQQIQKYEDGKNRVNPVILAKISDIFGVTPNFFFELKDQRSGEEKEDYFKCIAETIRTKDGYELNVAFAKIKSAETRRVLIRMIKALAQEH